MLGEYINGNYNVSIFRDGTKIRETEENEFISAFPECIDLKITNYCDKNCSFCHEDSSIKGMHGDILQAKFIDTIRPYTEIAIGGGNPLSHPDLVEFLRKLKEKRIIANMTVNQEHFMKDIDKITYLVSNDLIRGVGVSLIKPTADAISAIKMFPNAVVHIINGIINIEDLRSMYDNNLKVLILGYKQFRRGKEYFSESVENNMKAMFDELPNIINGFKITSFDNLAIEQLQVKRLLSDKEWDEFYMGDDGQFTMYIDGVNQKFARCSVSDVRYDLMNDISHMFKIVKQEEVL